MTPSLPRAPQIGSRQAVERIWIWFSDNGNIRKWDSKPFPEGTEYVAALSRTAQAPVADGVREAAQILLSEIDSATDMDCVIAASSALRTALASSDPTPATEAGGDEVAAQRLAASPLPSSSETEWRPIETAPHGVEVLLATPPFRCMGEQARWEMRVGCASWGERIAADEIRHARDLQANAETNCRHWIEEAGKLHSQLRAGRAKLAEDRS